MSLSKRPQGQRASPPQAFLDPKLGVALHNPEPHLCLGKIRVENQDVASERAFVRMPVTGDPVLDPFVQRRSGQRIGHAEAEVIQG